MATQDPYETEEQRKARIKGSPYAPPPPQAPPVKPETPPAPPPAPAVTTASATPPPPPPAPQVVTPATNPINPQPKTPQPQPQPMNPQPSTPTFRSGGDTSNIPTRVPDPTIPSSRVPQPGPVGNRANQLNQGGDGWDWGRIGAGILTGGATEAIDIAGKAGGYDAVKGVGPHVNPLSFMTGGGSELAKAVGGAGGYDLAKKIADAATKDPLSTDGGYTGSYDVAGNLARAQQQSGRVYDTALAASSGQAPSPNAITAGTVRTPGTISGDAAENLRNQQIDAVQDMATAPSAATAQMKANLGQIANAQLGAAATARGADRASAKRDAMLGIGTAGMGAAQSTAALAAQEEAAKRQAAIAGLAGVRAGDVSVAGVDLTAQEDNQRAKLTADQATEANRLAAYDATTKAKLGYLGAGTQATAAGTQAAGIASQYETERYKAEVARQMGLLGAGSGFIASLVSDERAKQDIGGVGSGSYSTIPATDPMSMIADPYAQPEPVNLLAWQQPTPQPIQKKGLIEGILSDERAKEDVARAAFAAGKASPWDSDGGVKEQAKRAVESMDPEQVRNWADTIDPITYRYKPGIVDGGDEPRLGVSAQQVEQSGPLGQLMVHKNPATGLREVDYGAMATMLGKAGFDAANEALLRVKRLEQKKGAR